LATPAFQLSYFTRTLADGQAISYSAAIFLFMLYCYCLRIYIPSGMTEKNW